MKRSSGTWLKTGAVGVAGLVVGGVLAGTLSANADDDAGTDASASTTQGSDPGVPPPMGHMGDRDLSQSQRGDEHLLHGDTLVKVRKAALARYPGATVLRIETDSDGVYEAHLTKADGTPVTVEVDKSFKVTGEEQMGWGGHGHFGGPGGQPPTDDESGSDSGDTT